MLIGNAAKSRKPVGSLRCMKLWLEDLVVMLVIPLLKEEVHRSGERCDVCELFGCTSWSRRFRIEVEDLPLVIKFVTKIDHPSFKTDLGWWINKTFNKTSGKN